MAPPETKAEIKEDIKEEIKDGNFKADLNTNLRVLKELEDLKIL